MEATQSTSPSVPSPDEAYEYDEVELILDDLRTRYDETPQWEFCEGFMAALVCCRRTIPQSEALEVLLGVGADDAVPGAADGSREGSEGEGSFADAAQRDRFIALWNQRLQKIRTELDTPTESLDNAAAYNPELLDMRGAFADLPEADRAAWMAAHGTDAPDLPALAQVWALGFMFAIETWPEEWAPPRDKKAAKWHDLSLQCIVALTEDDDTAPDVSPFSEDGPASVSHARLVAFSDAVWAVYDLREIWRGIGPRVETVVRGETLGRNDPCHCGSGKKFKKCHGA